MLDSEERRRHLYIVGQTGTGKSTLLLDLIRQDLIAGEGIALIDLSAFYPEAANSDRNYGLGIGGEEARKEAYRFRES